MKYDVQTLHELSQGTIDRLVRAHDYHSRLAQSNRVSNLRKLEHARRQNQANIQQAKIRHMINNRPEELARYTEEDDD